jgi:hypothetical protein
MYENENKYADVRYMLSWEEAMKFSEINNFRNQVTVSETYNTIICPVMTVSKFGYWKGVKGKAIPLQAWTGPEGSRRLRLPDFKTIGA